MGYYVEVRPRDTTPLSVELFKARFAKWLEQHPAATMEPDPETRKEYANDFMHSGGYLTVRECKAIPAGVTADARFSWGCGEDQFVGWC